MGWTSSKILSVVKGAGIAAAGAALAYLGHWASGIDPVYSGLVSAVIAVAVNALRKFAQDDEPATPIVP